MDTNNLILEKLSQIEQKLTEQNLLQKTVLNFNEPCTYLEISPSHLYKLTSPRQIPHFCPQGKKLYFNRQKLDEWLQRNCHSGRSQRQRALFCYIQSGGKRFRKTAFIAVLAYLEERIIILEYDNGK
jgi:excisionase family DNA binding protein